MVKIFNFVYCCGGLSGWEILDSCERYNLETEKWQNDVPNLQESKFSMTMVVLDKTWIYSFGGASSDFNGDPNGFEVERLNTDLIKEKDE